jgi:hypothetical protein
MTDVEYLSAKKDFWWNVGLSVIAFAMLLAGWHFGITLIREHNPTIADSLKIMALATAIPAFVLMVAWNRLSPETVGVILASVIGFALGKFS